jgi:hypothetical protein
VIEKHPTRKRASACLHFFSGRIIIIQGCTSEGMDSCVHENYVRKPVWHAADCCASSGLAIHIATAGTLGSCPLLAAWERPHLASEDVKGALYGSTASPLPMPKGTLAPVRVTLLPSGRVVIHW